MSNEKNFYLSERPDLVRRGRLAGRDPDRYRFCAAGYGIGMGAAIFTGEYDIAVIMVKAGLGIAALVILVFSTVTAAYHVVCCVGFFVVCLFCWGACFFPLVMKDRRLRKEMTV